jgi:hypothetical protein
MENGKPFRPVPLSGGRTQYDSEDFRKRMKSAQFDKENPYEWLRPRDVTDTLHLRDENEGAGGDAFAHGGPVRNRKFSRKKGRR